MTVLNSTRHLIVSHLATESEVSRAMIYYITRAGIKPEKILYVMDNKIIRQRLVAHA